MITKFKIQAKHPRPEITEVEVLRETEQSVYLPGTSGWDKKGERREAKITEWHHYYDTWEAAHKALLTKADDQLRHARRALELAQSTHGNIKGMRPNVKLRGAALLRRPARTQG